jgi:hydroxypyruvate isomerase
MDWTNYTLNCSILYGAIPIRDALTRARFAGFGDVEFWWPFTAADPSADEVDDFVEAFVETGMRLRGMNLFAGDMAAGDRGVLSWPGREAELAASVGVAQRVADATGCGIFNALYGRRQASSTAAVQDELALNNLSTIAAALAEVGGTVVVEPVSGFADYPLKSAADVVRVIDSCDEAVRSNTGLLLDVYHLSVNGDDVEHAIADYASRTMHVQVADAPGRGIPGSGELPIATWLDQLALAGYAERVALEFQSGAQDPFIAFRAKAS